MSRVMIVAVCVAASGALSGCAGGYGGDGGMHLSPADSPRSIEGSVPPPPPNTSLPDATPRRSSPSAANDVPTGSRSVPPPPSGEWSFNAERVVRDARCTDEPVVRMTGKGPAFETYASQCRDGSVLQIRCDYGACRPL